MAELTIKQKRAKAGRIGGPNRAKSLTPERRSEISRNAANARWEKARRNGLQFEISKKQEAESGKR